MKVGIIGSGGREHAICQSIENSSKVKKIYLQESNKKRYCWNKRIN